MLRSVKTLGMHNRAFGTEKLNSGQLNLNPAVQVIYDGEMASNNSYYNRMISKLLKSF